MFSWAVNAITKERAIVKKSNREKEQKTDIKMKQKKLRKITLIIIETIEISPICAI